MWNRYSSALTMLLKNMKFTYNECIEWTGALNASGHGKCGNTYWAKYYKINCAHQLSYIVAFGNYDRSLQVNHICDNAKCINPDHLYLGSQADNVNDMLKRGRHKVLTGEHHSGSKLTSDQVLEIRELCSNGISNKLIAEQYNVTPEAISSIKCRRSWKWL